MAHGGFHRGSHERRQGHLVSDQHDFLGERSASPQATISLEADVDAGGNVGFVVGGTAGVPASDATR
jgi:hypothetical protein